jgi:hypothetical protein
VRHILEHLPKYRRSAIVKEGARKRENRQKRWGYKAVRAQGRRRQRICDFIVRVRIKRPDIPEFIEDLTRYDRNASTRWGRKADLGAGPLVPAMAGLAARRREECPARDDIRAGAHAGTT